MLKIMDKIGQTLARLTKQKTPIDSALSAEKILEEEHNFFEGALPFREYCRETRLYYNKNSLGFVIEVSPLMGCSDFLEKEIAELASEIGAEGDSIQCLLLADHRVIPFIKNKV